MRPRLLAVDASALRSVVGCGYVSEDLREYMRGDQCEYWQV